MPAPTLVLTPISSDNFNRSDGLLGSDWAVGVQPNFLKGGGAVINGVIIIHNAVCFNETSLPYGLNQASPLLDLTTDQKALWNHAIPDDQYCQVTYLGNIASPETFAAFDPTLAPSGYGMTGDRFSAFTFQNESSLQTFISPSLHSTSWSSPDPFTISNIASLFGGGLFAFESGRCTLYLRCDPTSRKGYRAAIATGNPANGTGSGVSIDYLDPTSGFSVSIGSFPVTINQGDTFAFAVVGNQLFFLQNGTVIWFGTDTNNTFTTGLAGVGFMDLGGACPICDNFVVGQTALNTGGGYNDTPVTTVMGFTDHDHDILYQGVLYKADAGMTGTAIENKSDASVDNLEVTAFLECAEITEADLLAGLYDGADVEMMMVNYLDLTQGDLKLRKGTLGNVKWVGNMATAELRGLTYLLAQTIGETYGPLCRAELGSNPQNSPGRHYFCYVNLDNYRQSGSVVSGTPTTILPADGLLMVGSSTPTEPAPTGWFDEGMIIFTSGANANQKYEIKTWDRTTLTLFLPLLYPVQNGDTFLIEPGCDKLLLSGCTKFNNIINFRGEPYIPGLDQILDYNVVA